MKKSELYYGYTCPVGLHSWCSNALFLFSHSKAATVLAYCPAHGDVSLNVKACPPARICWIESDDLDAECYELDMFENWVNEVRKEAGL